ncbi:MAG: NUDIX hydrolase [Candidatus Nanopelagicales bacterium]|nr:NUDIX hydrolase [Candidatus Nanopelagicales bacterium]
MNDEGAEVRRAEGGMAMPRSLLERARQLLDAGPGGFEIVEPRSAATVALLRSTGQTFELLLQRRPATMVFAPRMHVFPGGVVEDGDHDQARWLQQDHAEVAADAHLACCDDLDDCFGLDVLPARVAAVRETAEETGYQIGDPRSLDYIAHWVTPEVEPRRYDTRFYATVIGAVGPPPAVNGESDAAHWIRPGEALRMHLAGEMAMLPPTAVVVRQFAEYAEAGLSAHESVVRAGAARVRPLLPVPRNEPSSPEGILWVMVDARTREQIDLVGGS